MSQPCFVPTYTLDDIYGVMNTGSNYTIPADILRTISCLCVQVGFPVDVKQANFSSVGAGSVGKTSAFSAGASANSSSFAASSAAGDDVWKRDAGKKRKHKGATEITDDAEWDSVGGGGGTGLPARSTWGAGAAAATPDFQPTKLEQKTGIAANIDAIRSCINKLTDKNYLEMRSKIVDIINETSTASTEELAKISTGIFEIASSNRYYSKIYADLYSDLYSNYAFIRTACNHNVELFKDVFDTIEYVDPNENYDRFCEINRANEKRKSLAGFFNNLMINNVIPREIIVGITVGVFNKIGRFITEDGNKNVVDELIESIAILYNRGTRDVYLRVGVQVDEQSMTIPAAIKYIAGKKTKDYKSLSNKTLFKFMDLAEIAV